MSGEGAARNGARVLALLAGVLLPLGAIMAAGMMEIVYAR